MKALDNTEWIPLSPQVLVVPLQLAFQIPARKKREKTAETKGISSTFLSAPPPPCWKRAFIWPKPLINFAHAVSLSIAIA